MGIEDRGVAHTLFVIADPSDVLAQQGVNRIVKDIQLRNLGITEVWFYSRVRDQPQFPSFAIYEQLAVYVSGDNKTYFGVAAKNLYGGWAYGPYK